MRNEEFSELLKNDGGVTNNTNHNKQMIAIKFNNKMQMVEIAGGSTPLKHSFMHTNLHPLATHYC